MKVEFIFDFTCPWCFIGFKRLKNVLETYKLNPIDLNFIAYQLNKTISYEGILYKDNLNSIFSDPIKMQNNLEMIKRIGVELGIQFNFEKDLITTKTLRAHKLLKWSPLNLKMEILEELFKSIFSDALNIGDDEVLVAISEKFKLGNKKEILSFLNSECSEEDVKNDYLRTEKMPILTIPFLWVDDTYQIQAAHLPDVIKSCLLNV